MARRLLNTSPSLVAQGLAEEDLEKFCWKMLKSGYGEKERAVILIEGRARYRNLCQLAESGVRPLYRKASWRKFDRAVQKDVKGKRWYGNYKSVLFVQATPDSLLKREIESVMEKSKMSVRVVEKSGRTVRSVLQRSSLEEGGGCDKEDECPVCLSGGRGPCDREYVCYRITCVECERTGVKTRMHGETARTGRKRCQEHKEALEARGKKSSNLWEHVRDHHGGDHNVEFRYDILSTHQGDSLGRQLQEALNIERAEGEGPSLNDKGEWVRPAGLRIDVARM